MRDFILSDNIYIAFLLSLLEKSPSFRFLETKVKGFKIPEDILGSLSRENFSGQYHIFQYRSVVVFGETSQTVLKVIGYQKEIFLSFQI